ncbi:hypothetical protein CVO77_00245 [Sphingopyxis lindanitolerans]|uniref:Uncharacterized protein n=1 Tax=Sphingopyxis lindanitolerans TaxID=2054227 RepID=A0A2S8BAF5_9SPHN|nr:hypothetical protein [Sphingopyxis lindanitolerans]PQM29404.1 hypothetical protein CVO77_00245 [Sphingopyxis lindanitolerans]
MGNLVEAIVRGPESYFDGRLFAPGEIVTVDEDLVSDEDQIEKQVTFRLAQPVVKPDGELVFEATRTVQTRTLFLPLASATAATSVAGHDRLNVTDFLKGGSDDIVASISGGKVDDYLAAIEQAELARRGPARAAVKDAIAARLAAKG